MVLTRSDYHLAFHGDKDGARVWIFRGPVDITFFQSDEDEEYSDVIGRLDRMLERKRDEWMYGEAPRAMVSSGFAGHQTS